MTMSSADSDLEALTHQQNGDPTPAYVSSPPSNTDPSNILPPPIVMDDRQGTTDWLFDTQATDARLDDYPQPSMEGQPKSTTSALSNSSADDSDPPGEHLKNSASTDDVSSFKGDPSPLSTEEDLERGFLPVLRNRRFLTLWSGQVFSQLADKVYLVLMVALIASYYQSDAHPIGGWVSAIMIAFTIPAVLFGSVAGALVDRWSKKFVLVVTNLLRGGLVLMVPPCLWLLQDTQPILGLPLGFVLLVLVTFLVSTLTQFFAPAEQAAIPIVVERKHLLSANSLYTTTAMASLIVGFAVGEPLLGWADQLLHGLGEGVGKAVVVGTSYSIAGIVLLLLSLGKADTNHREVESPHVWEDIRDGLRYLGTKPNVRTAMIQQTLLFSIFAALSVLAVRLAQDIPEISAAQFGFLLAFGGIGMAVGAGVVGSLGHYVRSIHRLSFGGWIGLAASLAGLAIFTHQLQGALVCITLIGFFAALVGVPLQTTIQDETAEEMRGKVFGLQNNGVNIALSLPLALAGIAEAFLHLPNVLLILAALAIAGSGLNWYISVKSRLQSQN